MERNAWNQQDLTGKTSGTLIAEKYLGNSKWRCTCQKCGKAVVVTTATFNNNISLGRDGCKHAVPILVGQTFGLLTVLERAEDYIKPKSSAHEKCWKCRCICGRTKVILESNLKSLKSLSCGSCSNRVSVPEKIIFYYLSKHFEHLEEQYRPYFLNGREIDIYIPSLHVGIEYDGSRWHKSVEADILKNKLCTDNGIAMIRIREPLCPPINNTEQNVFYIVSPRPTTNGTHMTQAIIQLISILNTNWNCNIHLDIDCKRDNADICSRIISTCGFNSLKYMYPDVAAEWDYDKNFPLTPDKVPAHTGKKAWWICPKCGLSYASVISSRTSADRCGCPKCRYTKAYKRIICIELNKAFESVKAAASYIGRKPCGITTAIKTGATCGGYHWEYE